MAHGILEVLLVAMATAITLWLAGAIYYDVCGAGRWSWVPAVGWCLFVLILFLTWKPPWRPYAALLVITLIFLGWWITLKPSHDREWDASVARLPRATRRGDVVTIENVRNNEYRAFHDFTSRYETRSYQLANLNAADIIFFYWSSPWMSHPVLVFDFGPDGRVGLSIEVRFRKGQKYSTLRSLYRQQELIYLVVDERDAVLRRVRHGGHQGYLYRLNEDADRLRTVFLDYVSAINDLCDHPRWYHALCSNCTTSFYRLPNSRCHWDWRVIANGRLDRALYEAGRLDRSIPFESLRQAAHLNGIAETAPEAGFGDYLRHEIERRRHG